MLIMQVFAVADLNHQLFSIQSNLNMMLWTQDSAEELSVLLALPTAACLSLTHTVLQNSTQQPSIIQTNSREEAAGAAMRVVDCNVNHCHVLWTDFTREGHLSVRLL